MLFLRFIINIKFIKKRYKILILILLILILVPVSGYFALQNSKVQTFLVHRITKGLSENLNARVTLESVHFKFFNRLVISNLMVEDQQQDTLLFTRELTGHIKSFNRKKKNIALSRVILEETSFNLRTDSAGTINLRFIINAIRGRQDTSGAKLDLSISRIELRESSFSLKLYEPKIKNGGINFTDLNLSDLSFKLDDFHILNDTVGFQINDLTFTDTSGFHVDRWNTHFQICPTCMEFTDVSIITPLSELFSEKLSFRYPDYRGLKDFINRVDLDLTINASDLDFHDIAYFASGLSWMNQNIDLSGRFTGFINDFKGKRVLIQFSDMTQIAGNFEIEGLPDINEAFLFVDIKNMTTSIENLEQFEKPGTGGKILLPESLKRLEIINFDGNFTGFVDDFVTYGTFTSNLGAISTDLSIKPDTTGFLDFRGRLKTFDLDVGELTSSEKYVGKLDMNVILDGQFQSADQFIASLEGIIEGIEVNGYNYTNINIEGDFTEKAYDGSISVEDPNVKLDFLGRLDFSGDMPEFDFTANVLRAKLHNLNMDKADTNSLLSFLLTANFTGNNMDNMNGDIKLLNLNFDRLGKNLQVYDFTLAADNQIDTSSIKLRTDFIDGDLIGKYEFAYMPASIQFFVSGFIPAIYGSRIDTSGIHFNQFGFDLRFKNMDKLTSFFFPGYSVSENATLSGQFDPVRNRLTMEGKADQLVLGGNEINKLLFASKSTDSLFYLNLLSEDMTIGGNLDFQNIHISSDAKDNRLGLTMQWMNVDSLRNEGVLNATADFYRDNDAKKPHIDISVDRTNIYIKDLLWLINQSTIEIDSTLININDFSVAREDRLFLVSGTISEQETDTLHIEFQNLMLSSFNAITKTDRIQLDGIANGVADLSGLYHNPLFRSDIEIENLVINEEFLGNSWIGSTWDTLNNSLHLHTYTKRGELTTLDFEGDYSPFNKEIDFSLNLNKLRLNIFRPFLRNLASDLNGIATGEIQINGTLNEPLTNGKITLQKASFIIDYLQTKYNFTDEFTIADNITSFHDVQVFDPNGNVALTKGKISNEYFRNFTFDITLEPKKFLFLSTREEGNKEFFGTAYGTGIVKITGPPKNLMLDVSAKTESGTQFFIPLNPEGDVAAYNFVTFIKTGVQETVEEKNGRYEVDLSGIEMNFDLTVTPEAEVQLVFDSKIGDIIKATGSGKINLLINTLGDFRIYGDYQIEQGDYLFTLQNVINKRFTVRNGGTITWNGDPADAFINLQAVYNVRTSLRNLFNDDSYTKRYPVECQLNLSNKLTNPDIQLDILLPTADEETKTLLKNSLNTEDKLSKQFLSLLVINSFLPDPNLVSAADQQSRTTDYTPAVGVTTSELLSNQLSYWLSQISNDFDIGFSYMPGDAITTNQVEVALSTQLLNDRVTINTNLDVGGQTVREQNPTLPESSENTSNIVGDFSVDIKLTKSGKLRMKAFNRANDNRLYELAPYTQGIGLFYREDFNSFDELMNRYWSRLFSRKEER